MRKAPRNPLGRRLRATTEPKEGGHPKQDAPALHWCFTWNNPSLSSVQFLQVIAEEWPSVAYAVFQLEKGEKDTPISRVMWVAKKTRFTGLKKIAYGKKMHWEKRRGTRPEARDYCMKDDETRLEQPLEYGVWVPGDNAPNKFLMIKRALAAGATELDIAEQYPDEYVKFSRGISKLIVIEVQTIS